MEQIKLPQVIDLFNFSQDLPSFDPQVLWIIFYVALLVVIVMSFILSYHWKNYSLNRKAMKKVYIIYFSGVVLSIIVMLISIKIYL
jgi:hypothetical protein